MKRSNRLGAAVSAVAHAFRDRLTLRLHLVIAAIVVGAGWYFSLSYPEWCIIILCIGSVLTAELFSTAMENNFRTQYPKIDYEAGTAKDIAAGAVLMVCCASVIIGMLIFIPHLSDKIF